MKRREARLVGWIPFGRDDGFAQAMFKIGEIHAIQIPDARELSISRFAEIEVEDDELRALPVTRVVSVGGPLIYCFIWDGRTSAGTLAELRSYLRELMQNLSDSSIALQIADLIGTNDEIVRERDHLEAFYRRELGDRQGAAFVRASIFPDAVWRILMQNVAGSKAAKIAADHRNWILHAASPAGDKMFPDALSRWMREELAVDPDRVALAVRSLVGKIDQPDDESTNARFIMSNIRSHGRQERRLLELLRSMIEHPAMAERLLYEFKDFGQFANNAADLLRRNRQYVLPEINHDFLDWYVNQLLMIVFPQRRGVLLLDMAEVLGHIPSVAAAIEHRMNKSIAQGVLEKSRAISDALYNREERQLGLKF